MLVETRMRPLRKAIEAHSKHGQRGKAGIGEANFASISVIPATPGHDLIANLGNQRRKILGAQFKRSNRQPYVFEREGPNWQFSKCATLKALASVTPVTRTSLLEKLIFNPGRASKQSKMNLTLAMHISLSSTMMIVSSAYWR